MKSLELYAMEWLRYQRRCIMVLSQRCPRYCNGVPDVIGVLESRLIVEIECKRTLADFKNNGKKWHIRQRETNSAWDLENRPYQFYFMVPFALVHKVEKILPEWAGLMHTPAAFQVQEVHIVKKAPINKHSKAMDDDEFTSSIALMTNQILAQQAKINQLIERLKHGKA